MLENPGRRGTLTISMIVKFLKIVYTGMFRYCCTYEDSTSNIK